MNNDQKLSTVFSLVMVLATVTLGWISFSDRIGPRVADSRTWSHVPTAEQDVVARLWEDPLQAVQTELSGHQKKTDAVFAPEKSERPDDAHATSALAAKIEEMAAQKKVTLLIIPIPDTPFPDDLEVRLRLRYAVQLALAEEEYTPEKRNHIGYFKFPARNRVAYIPYESFEARAASVSGHHYPTTFVLWLPESLLADDPLRTLSTLCRSLCPEPLATDKLTGLFVIGPRASDTLKQMISSAEKSPEDFTPTVNPLAPLRGKLAIFSPQATTPDPILNLAHKNKWEDAREDFSDKLYKKLEPDDRRTEKSWRYFYNFVATDDQLTDVLAVELALRGLDLRTENDKILVMAETDTSYGRSLPAALETSLESYRRAGIGYYKTGITSSTTPELLSQYVNIMNPPQPMNPGAALRIYRYLRGLDQQKGQDTNVSSPARTNAKSPEDLLSEALRKRGSMALGESQLDYAERLAENIKRSPDLGNIKAVGVLGADIYDKLILLRSLRPKFPGAIFFTTDLDARMWHPDHLSFTRNMVVASAYDINLGHHTRRANGLVDLLSAATLAPFRDGYQVAVFRACRAALRKARGDDGAIDPPPRPRVFEIGKNGPVLLTEASEPTHGPFATAVIKAVDQRWPRFSSQQIIGIWWLAGAFVLALVSWAARERLKYKTGSESPSEIARAFGIKGTVCATVSAILLSAFWSLAQSWAQLPGGEPWAWSDGVSIWPTEWLRLVIVCSVVTALVWAWRHFATSRGGLIRDYFEGERLETTWDGWKRWEGVRNKWPSRFKKQAQARVSATEVFQIYLSKAQWECRAARVAVATLSYACAIVGLIYIIDGQFPDLPHIRGEVARWMDLRISIVSALAVMALLFYVLDAVWLSAYLFKGICGPVTKWPDALITQSQERFKVSEDDLSGYLDVKFAAEKSSEVGKLVFFPFVVQFLWILSRNSYFDHWSWPPTLVAVFVCNMLLACAAWAVLRRAAKTIRSEALGRLERALDQARRENEGAGELDSSHSTGGITKSSGRIPPSEDINESKTNLTKAEQGGSNSQTEATKQSEAAVMSADYRALVPEGQIGKKERYHDLLILQRLIKRESRGAYAQFFQDPALIAMVLPTGVCGILIVLFRALFGAD